MRKNGFTLVELLAVIVVLAIVIVIAAPSLLNSGDKAKEKITEIEEHNLKDAGKMLALDLDDSDSDIYNCKSGSWIASYCSMNNNKWSSVNISVGVLKSHNYFSDNDNHLNGYLLTINSNHTVTISK